MEQLSKRQVSITLEKRDTNNNVEYSATFKNGLDVKFSYTRFLGNGMFGRGRVSICGLSMDTIAMFTSFWSEDTELAKKKIVKVSAGYEGQDNQESKMGTIIEGSIVSAIPTMPPDIWLNCEVINSYETKFQTFSFTMKGKYTLKQIVENIANFLKLEPVIRIDKSSYLNRQLKNISFLGNKFDLVSKIEDMFPIDEKKDKNGGIIAYIEDNSLVVDYSDLELNQYNRNGEPILIDKSNGMVGVPEPMWAGQAVKITTLLNPAIKTGDVIQLKSDLIPSLNGYYYVFTISYEGQFRGTNWYSSFVCKRLR